MQGDDHKLSESLENYLEVILELENIKKVARAKDIANKIGVLRGSVTSALKSLSEKGLIHYEPYNFITLTEKGAAVAYEVRRRHDVIKEFFEKVLIIDPEKAEASACRMEHAIDKTIIDRLVKFIEYVYQCPQTGANWIEAFVTFCSRPTPDQDIDKK